MKPICFRKAWLWYGQKRNCSRKGYYKSAWARKSCVEDRQILLRGKWSANRISAYGFTHVFGSYCNNPSGGSLFFQPILWITTQGHRTPASSVCTDAIIEVSLAWFVFYIYCACYHKTCKTFLLVVSSITNLRALFGFVHEIKVSDIMFSRKRYFTGTFGRYKAFVTQYRISQRNEKRRFWQQNNLRITKSLSWRTRLIKMSVSGLICPISPLGPLSIRSTEL